MPLPAAIDGVYKPASTSKELKEFIKCIQPYTGKTADGKKLRKHGFGKCDMNGSGECSLAEVDSFVLTNLKADYGPKLEANCSRVLGTLTLSLTMQPRI